MGIKTQTRVCLYGNSVILGSLGASLEKAGRFEIIHLSPPLPRRPRLEALAPDVILFDSGQGQPDAAFALLRDHPDLVVLGISPDGNVVQSWSGCQYHELSSADLTALIEAGSLPGSAPAREKCARLFIQTV